MVEVSGKGFLKAVNTQKGVNLPQSQTSLLTLLKPYILNSKKPGKTKAPLLQNIDVPFEKQQQQKTVFCTTSDAQLMGECG